MTNISLLLTMRIADDVKNISAIRFDILLNIFFLSQE